MSIRSFCGRIKEFIYKYYLELLYTFLLFTNLVRIIPSYQFLSDFWRSYILNYYVLSYQRAHAFVSRGLIGSIVQLFFKSIDSKIFYLFFWGLYFLTYFILGKYLIKKAKKCKNSTDIVLIVWIIMFSPAIMNYAVDFGRPDIFMVLLVIACMTLVYKRRFWIMIPILCCCGIFIHEGFIVFFLPLILMYMLVIIIKEKSYRKLFPFTLTVVASIISLFFVFAYGKNAVHNVTDLYNALQSAIDVELNPNMIDFEFGNLKQSLSQYSIDELSSYKTKVALVFYALIYVPILMIYFKVMKIGSEKIKYKIFEFLYIIAPFSGLLMIGVGVDYGRWFSMVITACVLQGYFCICENDVDMEKIVFSSNPIMVTFSLICILGIYVVIGPMGDIHEHFDYLNFLKDLFDYVRGFLL